MYEKYSHTERTVVERGDVPPLTTLGVVCILWAFLCLLLAFVFAVTDGLLVSLGIGACGFVGLLFLLLIAAIPAAKKPDVPTVRLNQPVDSTALTVRKSGTAPVRCAPQQG